MSVTFVEEKNGIKKYRLTSGAAYADIIDYGARIDRLCVPDKNGRLVNVLCGFDDVDGYRGDNPYFNAIVGRCANRIGGASFELDGVRYQLYENDQGNHLHGGRIGFDRRIWQSEIVGDSLRMTYVSPDGEEGYPGTLTVVVTYSFVNSRLSISYEATTDRRTIVNLTNHAYFNLNGDFSIPVYNHFVRINASCVTEISPELIPTGKVLSIEGSDLDWVDGGYLDRINGDDELVRRTGGYDFNYVLNDPSLIVPVAEASSDITGIRLEVYTDRPCMQLYTGNFLDGFVGRDVYPKHGAFCMETQGYPNACNIPAFPAATLDPNETFRSKTIYAFSVVD